MVKMLVALIMMFAAAPIATAAVRIAAHADRTELVLGEALNLEIRIQGADAQALDALTLDELQADFDVAAVSRSVRPRSAIITVTLIPLRPGVQHIPALKYLGEASAPLALTVRDAGRHIPRVLIRTGIAPAVPRVREAALLYLDVFDNGSLQWSPVAAPDAPGMHLRALAESQREEVVEGTKYVVHRYAWAALPLRDGPLQVNFPRLNAIKFGTRLRYAAPPLAIIADPIPAWLPVHVPVGAPQLISDALPAGIETQRPFNWQLRVSGAGLSEQGIVKIIGAALRNSDALYFYPPTVQLADAPRAADLSQTFLVTIPLRIQQGGDINLPPMVFPYYDLTREQLAAVSLDVPHITAINPMARLAVRVAIGLAVLLTGIAGALYLYRLYRRARARAAALQRVRGAANVAQLKTALLQFNPESRGTPVATLGQWLQKMPGVSAELKRWVRQLEQASYGLQKEACELDALRSGIAAELQRVLIIS